MVPLEIIFEGMETSDAVRARVEEEAEKLERFHDRITSCRVVVKAPNHHKHHGGLFETRIHMTMPGGLEVNIGRHHDKDHSHEDVYIAIRDAFSAARRQLQDKDRKLEGFVKRHKS